MFTSRIFNTRTNGSKKLKQNVNKLLYNTIERKVTKEVHRHGKPKNRWDGTLKKCEGFFRRGASPEVLTKLEKSLREQEKYYRYYVQCFLPALNRKISKKLDPIKKEEIGQVISEITRKSSNKNHYNRRNSKDSGVESDIEGDYEYSTDDTEPLIPESRRKGLSFKEPKGKGKTFNASRIGVKHKVWRGLKKCRNTVRKGTSKIRKLINQEKYSLLSVDENINDRLLEAAKQGNKRKFEKLLQKSADIRAKDGEDNNALHHIASLQGKQKVVCLKLILNLVEEGKISEGQLREAKNGNDQTPLQKLLFSKVKKEEHSSGSISGKMVKFLKRPFTEYDDSTIESAIQLFKLGANHDDLQLSKEELQSLDEQQKTYYDNFLEKLAESVKKSKLDKNTRDSVVIKIAEIIYDDYPLHKAVLRKDQNKFRELLKSDYDITTKDTEGNTVLYYAVTLDEQSKYDFTKLILEKNKELVNTPNKQQTPLHRLLRYIKEERKESSLKNIIQHIVKKESEDTKTLKLLLEQGADITAKDRNGNNALHYIASLEGKQKGACLNLILDLMKEGKISEGQLRGANNAKNGNSQTPLHQLLQCIKEEREEFSLKLLLRNGADITAKDRNGNNALHYIASLEGKQKVTCLKLILNLVKKDEFSKAAKATNEEGQTPLQVALITKTIKDTHNLINPNSRDNTIKFCVKLLQNGVDQKQLVLREELRNREYYKILKGTKEVMGRPVIPDDMETELKYRFGKKFKVCDIVKYINNGACKVVTTLVFAALACAVIFSASQGSITTAIASSIIAAIGVCYLIYLNLDNIYKGLKKIKGKFTEEKQITPQGNASKNDTEYNNSVQNIENKLNSSEKQEIQKPSDQQEHIESFPDTKMSTISIMNSLKNCVGIV